MLNTTGKSHGCDCHGLEVNIREGPGIPEGYLDLDYGTCGFRGPVDTPPNHLDHVVYRCGVLLAALPFLRNPNGLYNTTDEEDSIEGGAVALMDRPVIAAGVVITASHNPAQDNGIKLLEMDGNILVAEWEKECTALVNFRGPLTVAVCQLLHKYGIGPLRRNRAPYKIFIGHDTRSSSEHLTQLFIEGAKAMADAMKLEGTACVNVGRVTTPTVGFLLNQSMFDATDDQPYIEALKEAFFNSLDLLEQLGHFTPVKKTDPKLPLFYDCAYGVGGCVMFKFFDCLRALGILPHLCNSPQSLEEGGENPLNKECGSNYVLSYKKPPANVVEAGTIYDDKWFCTFDGDADRLAYFSPNKGSVRIVDGVHLLVIKMKFFAFILSRLKEPPSEPIRFGLLINPYANGSARKYIEKMIKEYNTTIAGVKWNLVICRVGIKHMQAKVPNYDVALFYEANGHGNVVFNKKCALFKNPEKCPYKKLIEYIAVMFSSPLGDAMNNSIFIEMALKVMRLTYEDVRQYYDELAYVNLSVRIPTSKRRMFKATAGNDIILEEPKVLQKFIEEETAKVRGARAFVRPSGTESLCRVYAEAPTEEEAQKLAKDIEAYLLSLL
ncbi:phosphoacetylglucosamine mutase [Babesia gibsoni]|uniref:Phosphoacetylglucosamine mutase n=1 Tax=Babesia gibsoni TaxID=33632 RepID=A0AAD8PEY1_BABGI|nr:phosphoacetylglucosamine mutase [Babesia gibsoni]